MNKFFFLLFLFFNFFQVSSKSFEELNSIIFDNTYTKNHLEDILKVEKSEYLKNPDHSILLNIKYIESFIADHDGNVNLRIQKLLWIIENSREKDYLISIYSNYHLGSILNFLKSYEISKKYAINALYISKKHKVSELTKLIYSLKASISYNSGQYEEAFQNYSKALKYNINKENKLFISSMLNNISLCKAKIGDYYASNSYIYRSLYYIKKIKNKNKNDELFKVIVEGNLGSNFHLLNKIDLAKFYLEKEVNYYITNNLELNNVHKPIQELIEIYTKENNTKKIQNFIQTVNILEKNLHSLETKYNLKEILYCYYFSNNDYQQIKYLSADLIKLKKLISDSILIKSKNINNLLYAQEIKHLTNQYKTKQKLVDSIIKDKQKTTLFLSILFSLVTFIFILLYFQRNRRNYKNNLIQKQKDELEIKQRMILEKEVKLKQEKITNLSLNLNLKKETEKAFLMKINEIKKRRNVDIESVLRELQLNIKNLLQIDKKNNEINHETDEENTKFILNIKEKHPNLSEHEINFCLYFRMELNSKEIASLTDMTSGTIRVYKTKIKNKLGLKNETNLNDYLKSI
ncbi:MAG: response regulator transcription factor [Flavobacteriia bacterium]|nr:response regulator transcription factor [Flavobacteriia bacterium]